MLAKCNDKNLNSMKSPPLVRGGRRSLSKLFSLLFSEYRIRVRRRIDMTNEKNQKKNDNKGCEKVPDTKLEKVVGGTVDNTNDRRFLKSRSGN